MLEFVNRRIPMVVAASVLMSCYAVVVASAVLGNAMIFGAAIVASTVVDVIIERYLRGLVGVLRFAQFGISHRVFVQAFMLLLLVAVTNGVRGSSRVELALVTATAVAVALARVGYLGLLTLVRRRVRLPVEFRNLSVSVPFNDSPVPRLLDHNAGTRLLVLGVVPVLAGALGVQIETFWPFIVSSAVYIAVIIAAAVYLAYVLAQERPERQEMLDAVSEALREHQPEIILYFSGSATSTYQVDMWLSTLERTNRRCCILLRERHTLRGLAATSLPVVYIPDSVDLMNFALPDARLALYVANVGKNIHFLREPRVKHVFIGHGDSDKVASFNPFSKVYDEIWVAGPAGRERYARAKVGVRDDMIVEVGRPQLDVIERGEERVRQPDEPLSVLYAPTWEGWTDDDFQTSLTDMGVEIVDRLLHGAQPVRLIYRPHPLTGTRDPRAAEANARIREMIANATKDAHQIPDASVRQELTSLRRQIRSGELDVEHARELERQWNKIFWEATRGKHLVVSGALPSMFDTFNAADVLVSDVSSVVTDFVASGKPYVVANPKGEPEEEYRETFPSVGGAYLLDPDCAALPDIMAAVSTKDPMAPKRALVRGYLLGPDHPSALDRWNTAVDALIARADADWPGDYGAGPVIEQETVLHA